MKTGKEIFEVIFKIFVICFILGITAIIAKEALISGNYIALIPCVFIASILLYVALIQEIIKKTKQPKPNSETNQNPAEAITNIVCKNCGFWIDKNAKVCPNCQREIEGKNRVKILPFIIITLIVLFFIARYFGKI